MSRPLKILQSDLSFYADFGEPAFGLLSNISTLHKALYGGLAPLGLRLADMKVERPSGSLGEAHVACSLPRLVSTVRVGLERVEVICGDTARVNQKQFEGLAFATVDAVARVVTDAFKSYTLVVNVHGTLEGIATRDYLSKLAVSPLTDLGPAIGAGVAFYHGAEADRLTTIVTEDFSAIYSDALFVKIHVVWDAGKVTLQQLPTVSDEYTRTIFDKLGLEIPPRST
jgi:hypothetical protein